MSERFFNQKELIDEDKLGRTRFTIVGAGAIGGFFTMLLSKMGSRTLTAYDFDSIDDHNLANQVYPKSTLGLQKVDALKTISSDYGDATITAVNAPWNSDIAVECDIFVSAVDNMDVRRTLWNHYRDKCKLFIDGRMSAQVFKVYGIDTTNVEACTYYETTLHTQTEASKERCGQKSIIYTVAEVTGEMLAQVKRYLMDEVRPTEYIYDCLASEVVKKTYHMKTDLEKLQEELKLMEVSVEEPNEGNGEQATQGPML